MFMKDALGASLEEICRVVPGGALVFFPSYKLLDKVRARWSQTGQWSQLNAQKPLFVGKKLINMHNSICTMFSSIHVLSRCS